MGQIYIREIDSSNIEEIKEVAVKPEQKGFIETVVECLQEAEECELWHPVGLYHKKHGVVGFAMYGSFHNGEYTWIDRIIIHKDYQGRGFGREAMNLLIEVVSKEYSAEVLYLSFVHENKYAEKLYRSIGFEDTNKRDPNGEIIYQYNIKKKRSVFCES